LTWLFVALGILIVLVLYQQLRIYQIHQASRNREGLFQIVTENAADMIALVDVKGRRLYNSPAYKRILGYSPAELSETSAFEQIHPDDRFRVLEAAREARTTGVGQRLEYRIKHKDGSWRVLESMASTIRDGNGQVAKLVIVNRDISERKQAELQLEHHMLHDALTGLPNRRLFLDRLQHRFALAQRDPARYALLLANLDHFKALNQSLGATACDQLLGEIARRIESSLRQEDTLARRESGSPCAEPVLSRLGGDEFTILLDAVGNPSDAMRVAERIQLAVAEPLFSGTREVRMTVSLGIALSTAEHSQPEDLLKDADTAMRRAKGLGGCRCEVFDETMHRQAVGRLRLEADLRAAMARREFRVYYQPVLRLDTQSVVSLEALLRWEHPAKGLVSPYSFLDAAEDTGLLVSIGHWLMLQACRQLLEWDLQNFSGPPLTVAVNLSARQFADPRLAGDLQEELRQTGLEASRLQLEVSDNVAMADLALSQNVMAQLKRLGLGVVLDDFGAGAASLRSLFLLPVDVIKIDRSLVRQLQQDRAVAGMIEGTIALARKMKLQVVAEGIETASLTERFREMGCELGQGYCFSQPLDVPAALQFLLKSQARTTGAGAS